MDRAASGHSRGECARPSRFLELGPKPTTRGSNPPLVAGGLGPQPGGLPDGSRGLSEATPPDPAREVRCTPEGCQRRLSRVVSPRALAPLRGAVPLALFRGYRSAQPPATFCHPLSGVMGWPRFRQIGFLNGIQADASLLEGTRPEEPLRLRGGGNGPGRSWGPAPRWRRCGRRCWRPSPGPRARRTGLRAATGRPGRHGDCPR